MQAFKAVGLILASAASLLTLGNVSEGYFYILNNYCKFGLVLRLKIFKLSILGNLEVCYDYFKFNNLIVQKLLFHNSDLNKILLNCA